MTTMSGLKSVAATRIAKALLISVAAVVSSSAQADEFPRWGAGITKYNESQVRNFSPLFDYDSDGCYPATPFYPDASLRQNPGLSATGTVWGACRDSNWGAFANTIHRQLCRQANEAAGNVLRCAHLFELYFEKDQAIGFSFLGGHRHDVETVIVWTGKLNDQPAFISHVSASAHGNYSTQPFAGLQTQAGHPLIVYHKDGAGTHAFRFANAGDKAHVEFLGNWGEFYVPDILSHYAAVAQWNNDEWTRYLANRQYRLALENSNFGSATFKTRNDGEILSQANNHIPGGDPFWANFKFSWDDVWSTRAKEFQANYPGVYPQISE